MAAGGSMAVRWLSMSRVVRLPAAKGGNYLKRAEAALAGLRWLDAELQCQVGTLGHA